MRIRSRLSILGIDPTPEGIAFVFFERGELVDWGTRVWRRGGSELDVLSRIVEGCGARVLVLEDPTAQGCRRRARIRRFLKLAAEHFGAQGLRGLPVSRAKVRKRWAMRGERTKRAVALALGQLFPELTHLVPPPRKIFQIETGRLHIFDALTLVLFACDRSPSVAL
jgi:hypothetical protein